MNTDPMNQLRKLAEATQEITKASNCGVYSQGFDEACRKMREVEDSTDFPAILAAWETDKERIAKLEAGDGNAQKD